MFILIIVHESIRGYHIIEFFYHICSLLYQLEDDKLTESEIFFIFREIFQEIISQIRSKNYLS